MADQLTDVEIMELSPDDFIKSLDVGSESNTEEGNSDGSIRENTSGDGTGSEHTNGDSTSSENGAIGEATSTGSNGNEEADSGEGEADNDVGETSTTSTTVDSDVLNINSILSDSLKFHGKPVKLDSVEELVNLAQKGLGVNKRMQEVKPQLKLMASLAQHDLDNVEAISLLIEASKGKPEAIKALMESNGLDYLDFGDVQGEDYKPVDQTIDDVSYKLKEVNDSVKHLDSYTEAMTTINKFEQPDLDLIREKPAYLGMVVEHKEQGVYNDIKNIVDTEQAKGNMADKSFLEAYSAVVEVLGNNLATSGKMDTGHNNSLLRNNLESGEASTPHDNVLADTVRIGSSDNTSTRQGNTSHNAAKAASQASTNKRKAMSTGVTDISKMTDDEIMNFDVDSIV